MRTVGPNDDDSAQTSTDCIIEEFMPLKDVREDDIIILYVDLSFRVDRHSLWISQPCRIDWGWEKYCKDFGPGNCQNRLLNFVISSSLTRLLENRRLWLRVAWNLARH